MARDTLLDFFADFAGLKEEFLVWDDGYRTHHRTYAEVARAARGFAAKLRAQGIGKGQKIVFWSENRPEWVAALWGCLLEGVIAVPIDFRNSADFVTRIAGIVEARAILTGDSIPESAIAAAWRFADFEWPAQEPAPSAPVEVRSDDIAQIVFTSGATAEPKGVIITHRNLLANIVPVENEIKKYRRYGRPFYPLRFLNLLPLSHLFGQTMATFIPPILAGTVVFQQSYHPEEILRQIRSRRVSVLVSVPKILEVLRDYILHEFPESRIEPSRIEPSNDLPEKPAQGRLGPPDGQELDGSPPSQAPLRRQVPKEMHWIRRWWRFRRVHRAFGWKFWAFITGAAPLDPAVEEFFLRLGFLVIQGYGLTETAPIVTLNHPFHTRRGSVGKPVGGVEIRLADDGEVLVRGGNVSRGYFGQDQAGSGGGESREDGWLQTGDIGEMDAEGRLSIRGRKKDMIVLPDGRKVFPEDVEAVLRTLPGVRDCAVIGPDQVHAVLVTDAGADTDAIVRRANEKLEDHQKIRSVSPWPAGEDLPRTPGTGKLKRAEVRQRVFVGTAGGLRPAASSSGGVIGLLQRYAPNRAITPETTLDELGLSSLDRVQLLVEMEQQLDTAIDEGSFTADRTVADLTRPAETAPTVVETSLEFPSWNRSWPARWLRRAVQATLVRPLTRYYTRVAVSGVENLRGLKPPVIFAPNHQSFMDVPAILYALPPEWRSRLAPAMAKEWFEPHFHAGRYSRWKRFTSGLQYYSATLFFNAFPLPKRESARRTLRYMGSLTDEGLCVLIFPEGDRTHAGEILPFFPGVAMLAARTRIPVVPVRLQGLERVFHRDAHWPTHAPSKVTFGAPLMLEGVDYAAEAKRLEDAVRNLR
jgi:long-chain acyl-CoA synthetase